MKKDARSGIPKKHKFSDEEVEEMLDEVLYDDSHNPESLKVIGYIVDDDIIASIEKTLHKDDN